MATTFQFIFEIIAIVSLAVIIYVVSRGVPRVPQEEANTLRELHVFDRIIARMPLQKFDALLERTIKKFLRKLKINLMKVDHVVSKRLEKGESSALKEEDGNSQANKNE